MQVEGSPVAEILGHPVRLRRPARTLARARGRNSLEQPLAWRQWVGHREELRQRLFRGSVAPGPNDPSNASSVGARRPLARRGSPVALEKSLERKESKVALGGAREDSRVRLAASFPWSVTRTFPGGHASAVPCLPRYSLPPRHATTATAASVATSLRTAVRELRHRVRARHELRGDATIRADEHGHRRAVGAERGTGLEALVDQHERREAFRARAL